MQVFRSEGGVNVAPARLSRMTTGAMQPMSQPLGRLARSAGIAAILAVATIAAILTAPSTAAAGRVFIDPGHGGSFPGASYSSTREADLNLAIARGLDAILVSRGYETAMSRSANVNVATTDIPTWSGSAPSMSYARNGTFNVYDDLQARCDLANTWGADIFVSIHANAASSSSAHGAETYWRNQSATDRILSERLARCIQEEYVAETGLSDRGVKVNAYYVLRWSNMPAVLIETGFMSNSTELAKLKNPAFQRKAALGIARGIDRFFETQPFTQVYPRISGADRYETAVAVADRGWPLSAQAVILTSGTDWPDALAGTPLSRPMGAPILLTQSHRLSWVTGQRIEAQAPTHIVVFGGESAVSSATVNAAVAATGHDPLLVEVERLAGDDRYETAAAIARRVRVPADGRVFVVSGQSYADALSIAPFAGMSRVPVLLVEPDRIPDATRDFIADNAGSIKQFEVVGGEAVIGANVIAELATRGHVVRISGQDRYETNVAVNSRFCGAASINPLVANGQAYPDALAAGALGALQFRPVIFVGSRYLSPVTREFLLNNASRTADPTIVGGPAAIPYQTDWMIRKGFER